MDVSLKYLKIIQHYKKLIFLNFHLLLIYFQYNIKDHKVIIHYLINIISFLKMLVAFLKCLTILSILMS